MRDAKDSGDRGQALPRGRQSRIRTNVWIKKEEPIGPNWTNGSPGGTRTPDKAVNSRLLYQLSYRGKLTGL